MSNANADTGYPWLDDPSYLDGDEYGRYEGEDDEWVTYPRPGTLLGTTCLDAWSIEMMDLDKFTAAGGRLDDQDSVYTQILAEVTPGRYRLTVLNEEYKDAQTTHPRDFNKPMPDATVARLERIG